MAEVAQVEVLRPNVTDVDVVKRPIVEVELVGGPRGRPGIDGVGAPFTQTLTGTVSVFVDHNLAHYPASTLIDDDGYEVECKITHVSPNRLIVDTREPFTGIITCI